MVRESDVETPSRLSGHAFSSTHHRPAVADAPELVPHSRGPSRAENAPAAINGVQVALDRQNPRREPGGSTTGYELDDPCPPEKLVL